MNPLRATIKTNPTCDRNHDGDRGGGDTQTLKGTHAVIIAIGEMMCVYSNPLS